MLANGGARLALALRLTADHQVLLLVDHQAQALPHDRVIVDDEDLALLRADAVDHVSSGQEQRTEAPPFAEVSSTRSPPSICAR